MSRPMLDTAAKLLAKAQSTTSAPEAIALVERSYGLLAQVITAYDMEHGDATGELRRRERRRLQDRRRRSSAERASSAEGAAQIASARTGDSIARYRRVSGGGDPARQCDIDVVL